MNKHTLFSYLQIALGTLIAALGVTIFMEPGKLVAGGLTGLLLTISYVVPIPVGLLYFLLNVPIAYWLLRLNGLDAMLRQLFGIASFSAWLIITDPLGKAPVTTNPLVATIYAGVLMGLGLGLALRVGGSTGGFGAMANIVEHYTGLNTPKFLLLTDLVVLGLAALTNGLEAVLYGLVMTFVLMRVVQAVQEGFSTSRCLLIVTHTPDLVGQALLCDAQRGVTRLSGMGEYSGNERPVLMCVVAETEVTRVKKMVLSVDPAAFLVITDAREVSGRGFTLDTETRRIPFWVTQRGA